MAWDATLLDQFISYLATGTCVFQVLDSGSNVIISEEIASSGELTRSGSTITGALGTANGATGGGTAASWRLRDGSVNKFSSSDLTGLTILDASAQATTTIVDGQAYTFALSLNGSALTA